MPLQNNNVDITDFLRLTATGFQIATFTQIRAALINRYKQVYGSDIDLSTASADGIFVTNLALIINNILQGMQNVYGNLDVTNANGIYLDKLCALSNIYRKPATYSSTSLLVKNIGTQPIENIVDPLFIDQAGNEWEYNGSLSLAPEETRELFVTCTVSGQITAPIGWINQSLELLSITVVQENPANPGHAIETDAELRTRRTQSSGASGVTVMASLVGALLNVSGIRDAYIYNNNTGAEITAKDGTTVDAHSIYVIIRKDDGITILDETIGTIIHEKLTPGIHSCDSNGTNGIPKNYLITLSFSGETIGESEQHIYWKEATAIAPEISIKIRPYTYFTTDNFASIAQKMYDYLNALPITYDLVTQEILIQTVFADPKINANATYSVLTVSIDNSYTNNTDTFYHYSNYAYTLNSDGTYTLTLT